MKNLVAFVFILLYSVTLTLGQEFVPGYLVGEVKSKHRSRRSVTETNAERIPNFCLNIYGPVCENCNTLMTCANVLLNSQTCSSIDPSKPYCDIDKNVCVSTPIAGCFVDFRCTSIGQFPNPDDCTAFYLCTALNNNALMYRCPSNYVYDSPTGQCKQKKTASDCLTISCANNLNRYQVFAGDKSILIYCLDIPGKKETILFRCKDYVNMQYDATTYQCNYICKSEGRFTDRLDCTKYYACYKSGSTLLYDHVDCPSGYRFDDNSKMCAKIPSGGTCRSELS